jgi:hypothetical protein
MNPQFTWLSLEYGEVRAPLVHARKSLLVLCAGSGTILGEQQRPLLQGEVVTLPAGREYGVIGGPDGLQALCVQCDDAFERQSKAFSFQGRIQQ